MLGRSGETTAPLAKRAYVHISSARSPGPLVDRLWVAARHCGRYWPMYKVKNFSITNRYLGTFQGSESPIRLRADAERLADSAHSDLNFRLKACP
jgi:hypothetical protein